MSDFSTYVDQLEELQDPAIDLALRIATAMAIWIIGKWVIRKAVALLANALALSKTDATIAAFMCNVASGVAKVMLAITVIGTAGFDTGPFTALLAGATFAIAYSFQDSLGHVAAGISLLYLKSIAVGDFVKAADVTGVVEKVEVFFSHVRSSSGREYWVPNGNVIEGPIFNLSKNKYVRAELEFEVSNDFDLGEIRRFLIDAMIMNSSVEPEPEPDVVVSAIREETLVLLARAWVPSDQYLEYRHAFLFDVHVRWYRSKLSLMEGVEEEVAADTAGGSGSDLGDIGEGSEGAGDSDDEKAAGDVGAAAAAAPPEIRKVSGTFVPD